MAKVKKANGKGGAANKSAIRKRSTRKLGPTAEQLEAAIRSLTSLVDDVNDLKQARASSAQVNVPLSNEDDQTTEASQDVEPTPILDEMLRRIPEFTLLDDPDVEPVLILEQDISSESVEEIMDAVKCLQLEDRVSELANIPRGELQEPPQYDGSASKVPADAECSWSALTEPILANRSKTYMTVSQSALRKAMLYECRIVISKIEKVEKSVQKWLASKRNV
ncbi:hypothetical protein BX666DRAFT_1188076 [Dichotomocladium elegans]|nr:hypothetical protein BX666DRAFT_1188076 [Dichotomocladium elegans]